LFGEKTLGKIVSEAGEVKFEIKSVKREAQDLVVIGTMGVWESKVYLTPEEMMRALIPALSSPRVLLFILSFPIVLLKNRFRSKKRSSLVTS
jgi:hypothetical protein